MKMLSDLKAARLKKYNLNILDAQGAAPVSVLSLTIVCFTHTLIDDVCPNNIISFSFTVNCMSNQEQ